MNAESPPPGPPVKPAPPDTAVLLEFMFRLGQGYLACGEQTAKVELLLRRTASAYGMRKSRVVAFPTAVFISLHDSTGERVTLAECDPQVLRLDQMADIYALGEAAQGRQGGAGRGSGAARGDPPPEAPLRTGGYRRRPHHPHGRAGAGA